ncbi:ribose 5-phosphate isomerase B [Halarsenatibacter silvermanii]|uniref:Ribose-5-phosphate isomerase n=1 Tax=Halarsenatibacter silvermanii TaxID=321763 RepID=A0A1G9HWE1_9FIRM|nr:ribose 5-phosphate isomerase B [Halarsenatibacter silvermanii]SDL17288.1 ribose-5-phosphate isomerase [Halarsenatibacter silvermanii]
MKQIILVCTGNTCRSPMAVELLRKKFADDSDYSFSSAGLTAIRGGRMDERAKMALKKTGIEPDEHSSRPLDKDLVKRSDLILTMTASQAREIKERYPQKEEYVFSLGEFTEDGRDVNDPFGGSQSTYEKTREQMEKMMEEISSRLADFFTETTKTPKEAGKFDTRSDRMVIAAGSDHAGFSLKEEIIDWLEEEGYKVTDVGVDQEKESVDYPDYASRVAEKVAAGEAQLGLLICGTGLGMSMTANKYAGVRAARCHDTYSARMARSHNDASILTMGERVIGTGLAKDVVKAFISTDFSGGRHARRVDKMENKGEMNE